MPSGQNSKARSVRLFRNGRNQAVRIPVDFELPGNQAMMSREGDRIIIAPMQRKTLLEVLEGLEPIDEPFEEINDPPIEPEDIF